MSLRNRTFPKNIKCYQNIVYKLIPKYDGRGDIVVRAHAFRAEGLWLESDLIP